MTGLCRIFQSCTFMFHIFSLPHERTLRRILMRFLFVINVRNNEPPEQLGYRQKHHTTVKTHLVHLVADMGDLISADTAADRWLTENSQVEEFAIISGDVDGSAQVPAGMNQLSSFDQQCPTVIEHIDAISAVVDRHQRWFVQVPGHTRPWETTRRAVQLDGVVQQHVYVRCVVGIFDLCRHCQHTGRRNITHTHTSTLLIAPSYESLLSTIDSVCPSPSNCLFFFVSRWNRAIFGRHFSVRHSTKRFLGFLI